VATYVSVDLDALRDHAARLLAVTDRFAAIREASARIVQDDEAYGRLCWFFPSILEDRHREQDEVTDLFAENIELLAAAIGECADAYEEVDGAAADVFAAIEAEL
jgi:hypothetical protein